MDNQPDIVKDDNTCSDTTEYNTNKVLNNNYSDSISSRTLVSLYEMGFKLVPLLENHNPTIGWTPIYDNPDYWQKEKFNDPFVYSKFKNVASTVGKSNIKDSEDKGLFIQVLDIDSEYIYNIITTPIAQLNNSQETKSKIHSFLIESLEISETKFTNLTLLDILKNHTFVTKTRKDYGFHIWWLSRNQNKHISSTDCKKGYEFEIKTDKRNGLCTLPPSTHRDDKNFRYSTVGRTDKLLVNDLLYDLFIDLFSEFLRRYSDDKNCSEDGKNNYSTITNWDEKQQKNQVVFYDLSPHTIQSSIDYLLPYYIKGDRHNFVFAFSGTAFHARITNESASSIIKGLCDKIGDTEKQNRLVTLQST